MTLGSAGEAYFLHQTSTQSRADEFDKALLIDSDAGSFANQKD